MKRILYFLIVVLVLIGLLIVNQKMNIVDLDSIKPHKNLQANESINKFNEDQGELIKLFKSDENPKLTDTCNGISPSSVKEYYSKWKNDFKQLNTFSDSDYDHYVRIKSVLLRQAGNRCDLVVNFVIKRDWLFVEKVSYLNLFEGSTQITPLDKPLFDNDSREKNKVSISKDDLFNKLAFSSTDSAVNFYLKKYNIENSNDFSFGIGFSTGDPLIQVNGILDNSQNSCAEGGINLITKETFFEKVSCRPDPMPPRLDLAY